MLHSRGPKTKRSVQPLPLLILCFPLWVLALLSGNEVSPTTPIQINLNSAQPVVTEPMRFVADGDRVTQLNILFFLPIDSSLSLSTQILDQGDGVILHFDKEGWRETGTWYEDGYSGTYDESDNSLSIRLKPRETQDVRLKFEIDSFQTIAGNPLKDDVIVQYWTTHYSKNQPALMLTLGVSVLLCVFFLDLSYPKGRICWKGEFDDLEYASRLSRMVYDQGLIKLVLGGTYDYASGHGFDVFNRKTYSSHRIKVVVSILDGKGAVVHEQNQNAVLRFHKEEDEDPYYQMEISNLFFRLESPRELRFRISAPEFVGPDDLLELDTIDVDLCDRVIVPLPVQAQLIR